MDSIKLKVYFPVSTQLLVMVFTISHDHDLKNSLTFLCKTRSH